MDIIEDYSFEKYVVGRSNEFAVSCAHVISEEPGSAYNPLLLYGKAGTGKSHLINAIAAFIREHNPDMSIRYITAEQFSKEFINAIRNGADTQNEWEREYDGVDVLMIEGVQYIAGKEATQEAFYKIFNRLAAKNRQIILTSDLEPRKIHDLDGRIYSRFVRGLVAGIDLPDTKVKSGILNQRLERFDVRLSSSVKELIVANASNAFEIEGMANKMNVFVKNYDSTYEITEEMAKRILDIEDKTD